jgi:two-component sensor histidine kinase
MIDGEMIWTPQIYEMLETKPQEQDKDSYIIKNFTLKEDLKILEENLNKLSIDCPEIEFVIRIKTGKGNLKYLGILIKAQFDDEGNMISRVGFNQDLTKTIEYENELKTTLNELQHLTKDRKILLQEIHHRVKNNLQIILSLLNLELRYHPDSPENTIQQTRNRINTMALIHEQVYQSNDATHVNSQDYIIAGMHSLFNLYSTENIHQNYNIENVSISIEKSIPLCLILNELALNTIKHAFPNGEEGTFNIELTTENNQVTVKVYDNGVGLSDNSDFSTTGLGFTIVQSLTNQLEGKLEIMEDIDGFGGKLTFNLDSSDINTDITVSKIQ